MKRDKTKLTTALKEAKATIQQNKAAFILLKVNDIKNALKYVKQIKRRNRQMQKQLWQMNYEEFKIAQTKSFEEGYGKPAEKAYKEFVQQNPDKAKEISIEVFLSVEVSNHKEVVHIAVKNGKPVPDSILKLYPGIEKDKPDLLNIKINRKILLDVITNTKPMTSCRHTLAILSSILISTKGDNEIEITATDLETGFQGIYPAEVISPGNIVISNQELSGFVSKTKAAEICINEKEKRWVNISANSTFCNIHCMDADDFPMIPEEINAKTIVEIDALTFKNMITKAIIPKPQNNNDSQKLHIIGALFKIIKNKKQAFLQMVSHNGGTLIEETRKLSISGNPNKEMIKGILIPKNALTKINRSLLRTIKPVKRKKEGFDLSLASNDIVFLSVKGNFVIIKKQNEVVIIGLLEGNFPNYHDIINRDESNVITVDRKTLLDAMKQMTSLIDSDYPKMLTTIETNVLKMIFTNPNKGEMRKGVSIEYEGETIEAMYAPNQFVDFLSLMESNVVNLDILDNKTPCLLTGKQDKNIIFVIMPYPM